MAISKQPSFASLDDLYLDPQNPRLGRRNRVKNLPQDNLLEIMRAWTLDELALSYIENNGFWTHEPLFVIREDIYGDGEKLVVVEGNRRLAALKCMQKALDGEPPSKKWERIVNQYEIPDGLFEQIPYLLADSRADVDAYLGFRHVTGVKQWDADEKAGYIAKLIEQDGLSYEQVMRKIGSKTPTVRQLYIAYKLLLQMEDTLEDFSPEKAENRFSLLSKALTQSVGDYVGIDLQAEPADAYEPVPRDNIDKLSNLNRWLFGTNSVLPIVTDTRFLSQFSTALEGEKSRTYLATSKNPKLEVAYQLAGGDVAEVKGHLHAAAESAELALSRAHLFKSNNDVADAVLRLAKDVEQLLDLFPAVRDDLSEA